MAEIEIYPIKNFPFNEFVVSSQFPELANKIQLTTLDKFKIYHLSTALADMRILLQQPIHILSGKRSEELNKSVGGSRTSDHMFEGHSAAVDFTIRCKEKHDMLWYAFNSLRYSTSFGQLIMYFQDNNIDTPEFIHFSLQTPKHDSNVMIKLNNKFNTLSAIIDSRGDLKEKLSI